MNIFYRLCMCTLISIYDRIWIIIIHRIDYYNKVYTRLLINLRRLLCGMLCTQTMFTSESGFLPAFMFPGLLPLAYTHTQNAYMTYVCVHVYNMHTHSMPSQHALTTFAHTICTHNTQHALTTCSYNIHTHNMHTQHAYTNMHSQHAKWNGPAGPLAGRQNTRSWCVWNWHAVFSPDTRELSSSCQGELACGTDQSCRRHSTFQAPRNLTLNFKPPVWGKRLRGIL